MTLAQLKTMVDCALSSGENPNSEVRVMRLTDPKCDDKWGVVSFSAVDDQGLKLLISPTPKNLEREPTFYVELYNRLEFDDWWANLDHNHARGYSRGMALVNLGIHVEKMDENLRVMRQPSRNKAAVPAQSSDVSRSWDLHQLR